MASSSQGSVRLLAWLLMSLCGLCLSALSPVAQAQALSSGVQAPAASTHRELDDSQALVLEVVLDGHVLSDSLTAYQDGEQFLLPLGELARLLT
ncbi:MAG: hypothetical protein EPO09_15970, partial [Aquabacterium sp.]|uniref:hypothetical protein n=1 Tax=Aquabacterium sp. TaxID=1872578 RepID=UPI0012044C1D